MNELRSIIVKLPNGQILSFTTKEIIDDNEKKLVFIDKFGNKCEYSKELIIANSPIGGGQK